MRLFGYKKVIETIKDQEVVHIKLSLKMIVQLLVF